MIKPRPHEIITAACEVFRITRKDFVGRDPAHSFARQVYCYVARDFGHKWGIIGGPLDRDHSTALVAAKVVADRIAEDHGPTIKLVALVEKRAVEIHTAAITDRTARAVVPEERRDRRISTSNDPPHVVWGMRKPLHQQHEDFARAIKEAHPELVKGKDRF